MYHGKPIIGLTGGIGSGKSFVAGLFGELGCFVLRDDAYVTQAYQMPEVVAKVQQWWGPAVVLPDGNVDRKAIAARVFSDPQELKRLEDLLHPLVGAIRTAAMDALLAATAWRQGVLELRENTDGSRAFDVPAFVWDIPLLYETGLNAQCDATVYVDAPAALREARVAQHRGWPAGELERREKFQWPLDRKREIADYVIDNTADADYARGQVSEVLSRIIDQLTIDQQ